MAAAATLPPPGPSIATKYSMTNKAHSCPNCGSNLPTESEIEEAQRRIRELEAQVELLKEKATAAGTFILSPLLLTAALHSLSAEP